MNKKKLKVAVVQFDSLPDKGANLVRVGQFIKDASKQNIDLFCLPENFLCRTDKKEAYLTSEHIPGHTSKLFSTWARKYNIFIHSGSYGETPGYKTNKIYNTSLLLDRAGNILAKYRKIHLFDAKLPNGKSLHESEVVLPGKSIVLKKVRFSSLLYVVCGFSVCFDLRFPEFYWRMRKKGAELLFIPSNFLHITGKSHWITLLRARAIETQSYVIAPNQCGRNRKTNVRSFGHSVIIDPWGNVLQEADTNSETILYAELDMDMVKEIRQRISMITP